MQLASLGVTTIPDTTGEGGAMVREVVVGSAAEGAELEVGDRIVAVDGSPIVDPADLFANIVSRRPGTPVEIELVRDGQHLRVTVELDGISP